MVSPYFLSWILQTNFFLIKGLTADDKNLYKERKLLWDEFNTAWLGIFQKQIEIIESGQQIPGATLITRSDIQSMADELIRLNDSIEGHGLVDYQYGVAEERIIEGN